MNQGKPQVPPARCADALLGGGTPEATVSIPGKLMLLGEHAVVYGYPCIVTTVNKYLTVKVKKINEKQDIILTHGVSDDRFVRKAIVVFRDKFSMRQPIHLETKSELGNYGLGSSSAVVVATLKALIKLFKQETPRLWRGGGISNRQLFNLSYKVVQKVQGLGSGFDLAACIWGGTVYFDGKSKDVEPLTNDKLPIIAGFSGNKANTVEMVNKVKELREKNSKLVEDIFKSIASFVEKGKKAIIDKDWVTLGKLMTKNHLLLSKLGVSTDKLDKLVSAACKAGAYGAKLSGAGGGDCIIALVSSEKRRQVEIAIENNNGEIVGVNSNTKDTSEVAGWPPARWRNRE